MKAFIQRQRNKFYYAFLGVWQGIRYDRSFQTQFFLGGLVLVLFSWWFWPLSDIELLAFILAWIFVLVTELQNSAHEEALDRLHPTHHQAIGASKDMAAGSVLLASLFYLIVMVVIAYNHLA